MPKKGKQATRKKVEVIQEQDDNLEELEPLEILVEDFEKFNDVERSFNQISEIDNLTERVKILVDFSRYLTDNGYFTESKIFAQLVEDNYEDSDALAECARVYFGHKEFGKCIEMNKKALLLNSEKPEQIQSDMGLALLKNGNLEEAIVLLESTIKDNPGYVDAYINLGLCYKEQSDFISALSSLENALKLKSNDARIYSNMGNLYFAQEKFEDSIVNYLKAQEFDPNDAETLNNLGLALMKIGNLDYSNLTFEEALRIEPGNPKIINNYLLCLLTGKQFAKYTKMLASIKRLITEKQYEKYRALHTKFMKVCGIHQSDILQKLKTNMQKNLGASSVAQSDVSWDNQGDDYDEEEGTGGGGNAKSLFSKIAQKKNLNAIDEESEDNHPSEN